MQVCQVLPRDVCDHVLAIVRRCMNRVGFKCVRGGGYCRSLCHNLSPRPVTAAGIVGIAMVAMAVLVATNVAVTTVVAITTKSVTIVCNLVAAVAVVNSVVDIVASARRLSGEQRLACRRTRL